ncbi:MAG: hypothetical protein HY220_04430 [Candidatus Sungbacteria bacterium]|uniref:Uncharacterized protein n=1 Tax=Candidatus Sungiibacteriota bacterium TaxID=2750080 RepID=A0A9D6LSK8_9BACT|nr:hypothetical protein [Candidatus Sungbacteria bacterium]
MATKAPPSWSKPARLFGTDDHRDVQRRAGVYRIRAFKDDGTPLPIARFAGIDPDGLMHIGKSGNVGTRVRMCRQACEGLKASHSAGKDYCQWNFERILPRMRLYYDYFLTDSESEARRLEAELQETY